MNRNQKNPFNSLNEVKTCKTIESSRYTEKKQITYSGIKINVRCAPKKSINTSSNIVSRNYRRCD